MLQMDTSEELAAKLQKALEENNSKCALQLLEYTDNQQELKNKSWDLIPIISQHLTEYNSINNVVLFECCVNLLRIISVKSNFEEALLQFISEVEEADSDVKFLAFLGPLTTLILQISDEKLGSYAWVFNSIQTYLLNCKIPEIDSGIDDRDKAVLRIIALYNEIIPFYENILHLKENQGVKGVLCKFLIQLLGAPLCYLKIDKSDTVKKSDGFVMNEKILNILFKCLSDPIFLLTEFRKSKKTDSFTKPNDLSIANLIYLLYSEKIFFNCIPQVYSFEYIFQSSTYLLSSLLENDDTVLTEKALKLGESLFKPLQNKNVTYLFLSYDEQCEFCKQLCYVIGYNSVESIRKDALKVFNYYLTMYETRGRYQLILNLVKILTHNNLKGYLITFYKNLMVNDKLNDSNYPSLYFKGDYLCRILKIFCCLQETEKNDLAHNSDKIIAALNLIRYLAINDIPNATNFWNYIGKLRLIFLKPLNKALDLSKTRCELDKKCETEFISVNNNQGDIIRNNLEYEEKMKNLDNSLLALDVIESLLIRVNELIDINVIIIIGK